jgi:transposase
MTTVNSSYSIPLDEYRKLIEIRDKCKKFNEKPNMTEIVRVAIYNLITEKKPEDISKTLNIIGRKQPGRPRKLDQNKKGEENDKIDEIDFSQISDSRWEQIKPLFADEQDARPILSDILFDLQNGWKRNTPQNQTTPKIKRWRRLKKWQENGIWNDVYHCLLPTYNKQDRVAWDKIFLKSFVNKRNR